MVATNLYGANGGEGTLSRITLALMQDSGWYDVNWAQAGECTPALFLPGFSEAWSCAAVAWCIVQSCRGCRVSHQAAAAGLQASAVCVAARQNCTGE